MKKDANYHCLIWIPLLNLFLYLAHLNASFPDYIVGAFTGVTIGLSVLFLYLAYTGFKKPKNIQQTVATNWKKKILKKE